MKKYLMIPLIASYSYGIPIEQKIGNILMIGFSGEEVSSKMCRNMKKYDLGGVILYDTNIKSKEQLKSLTSKLQKCSKKGNLLISVDQEGGRVQRLKAKYGFFGKFKKAIDVEKMNSKDIFSHYLKMAKELKSVGINYNLAPVVDLNINKKNKIIAKYGRSYSENPRRVAIVSNIFINAHESQGILTSLKHFPGHGSSLGDTHKGFVDVTNVCSNKELLPFSYLKDNADSVMMAHIFNEYLDKKYPSSLSKRTIGVLRDSIEFKGVVITDDLLMGAIQDEYKEDYLYLAKKAGNDILLISNQVPNKFKQDIPTIVSKLKVYYDNGDLSEKELDMSIKRINKMKSNIGI